MFKRCDRKQNDRCKENKCIVCLRVRSLNAVRARTVYMFYPILLTCQIHTDYTIIAHDILIFEKCSVVFVICTDKCGIHFTRTVIAQGFEAQVSTGREVESAWVQIFLHTVLNTVNTYII